MPFIKKILKYFVVLGVQVKKTHTVISCSQRLWLKSYMDFHTQKWAQPKHEFDSANVKLMYNSVFGKCMGTGRKFEVDHERANNSCIFLSKTHARALAILTVYIW